MNVRGLFFVLILSLLLFTNLTLGVTSVEVVQTGTQEKQPPSTWDTVKGIILSPVLWGGMVILLIILAIGLVFAYLIGKLIRYLKFRNNLFYNIKKEKKKLCTIQATYPKAKLKHSWKIEKNIPIRLARIDAHGNLTISKPIAYYRGDYYSNEGNLNIAFSTKKHKTFMVMPSKEILVIPNGQKVTFKLKDHPNDIQPRLIEQKLPLAQDIVRFNDNEILLWAEGISHVGKEEDGFYIPVLKANDGVVNLALPIYEMMKDVALGNYLYEQTTQFAKVSIKAVDMNAELNAQNKLKDNNTNVDIPTNRPQS